MVVFPMRNAGGTCWSWWFCAVFFCFLVLRTDYWVSAEFEDESDLIFDSLDQNLNQHRIARQSSSNSHSKLSNSSPSVAEESHWLSSTLNRIKRSIGSLFSTKNEEAVTEKRKHVIQHKDKLNDLEWTIKKSHGDEHHHKSKLTRKHRQVQNGLDLDEEYEDDEQQQMEDFGSDYDNTGDYNEKTSDNDDYDSLDIENGNKHVYDPEDDFQPADPFSDDEDLNGYASGEPGSGEVVDEVEVVPSANTPPSTHPKYYRITFTAVEPYKEDYRDRNSNDFQHLALMIEESIQEIFADQPGTQSVTVISLEKDADGDPYKTIITADVESRGFHDNRAIRRVIEDKIIQSQRIGNLTVTPVNFYFRAFEDQRPSCESYQYQCQSGQCVPSDAKCNGIRECDDGTDEVGCTDSVTQDTRREEPLPTTEYVEPALGPDEGSGLEPETPIGGSSNAGRADDEVQCANGNGFYHGDQRCDTVYDCQDGSDEWNCPAKCAVGEYGCDMSRCIPIQKRCDGMRDCSDETDERECQSCNNNAFHCDQNKCLPESQVCDGTPDCRDGSDESHERCHTSAGTDYCIRGGTSLIKGRDNKRQSKTRTLNIISEVRIFRAMFRK